MRNDFRAMLLQTGDVLVCRTEGAFARLIRFFGSAHTGSARVNHAALVLREGADLLVWEAGPWGIKTRPLDVYAAIPLAIFRYCWLGDNEEKKAAAYRLCIGLVGQSYGFLKLPLFALDGVGGWVNRVVLRKDRPFYLFTKTFGITHFKVCSNAVGYVYEKVFGSTEAFGIPWRSLSPDLIDDHCTTSPHWDVIHDSLFTQKLAKLE